MPGAHDAIPIYLYLLTPQLPTYLPNYTEWSTRSDKRFTYRTARWIYRSAVCDVDILKSRPSGVALSRAEPSWADPRRVYSSTLLHFAPISGSRRNGSHTQIVALPCVAFSLSLIRAPHSSFTGIVALCTPRGTRERTVPLLTNLLSYSVR